MKNNTISQWLITKVVFVAFAIIALFIIGTQVIGLAKTTSSAIDGFGVNGGHSNTTVEKEDTVRYDVSGRFN